MALKLHVQDMLKPFELPTTIVSENEIYRRSVNHNERNGIKTTASFLLNSRPILAFTQACRRICLETIAIIIQCLTASTVKFIRPCLLRQRAVFLTLGSYCSRLTEVKLTSNALIDHRMQSQKRQSEYLECWDCGTRRLRAAS